MIKTSHFSRSSIKMVQINESWYLIQKWTPLHVYKILFDINILKFLQCCPQFHFSSISKDQLFGLWSSVSNTGDHMTAKMFENFLEKVYSEIKSAKQEAKHLEDVLEKWAFFMPIRKGFNPVFFLFAKVMTKSFSIQEKHDRGTARQYFDYLKITRARSHFMWHHHRHYSLLEVTFDCFFRILSSIKVAFGQIHSATSDKHF